MKKSSKVFDTEAQAKEFAEKVGGTVKMTDLPGYMSVETVYVVHWDDPKPVLIYKEDAENLFKNARWNMKPEQFHSMEEYNTKDNFLLNAEQFVHFLPEAKLTFEEKKALFTEEELQRLYEEHEHSNLEAESEPELELD